MDKTCRTCKATKPAEDFYADKSYSDGRATECKACARARIYASQMRPPRHQTPPGTKRCTLCKETKPDTEFYHNKAFHDGLDRKCKMCSLARHDAWRRKNLGYATAKQRERYAKDPARYAEYERKQHYGMERGQYERMLAEQNGRCAICGINSPAPRKHFHVDHDHITGAVRGLLCGSCNNGLGRFQDNPSFLRTAADYLENSAKRPGVRY